ncbi:MAG: hypothetical protein FWG90_10420 [Oscillospiraceae bacterium]|nr:hypothetical protein [Oscillospiraceae bacterium]
MIEEKVVKKRDWIKNAAIVFLLIMLLLTFFSNTIMNYSLPEIGAQYPRRMQISDQIRGSGTVEASESYEVMIEESRVIASIPVKVGETVEKGQNLILLEDIDSAELATAKNKLDELRLEYQKALLSVGVDYSLEELEIRNKEEDVLNAKSDLSNIAVRQAAYEKARNNTADKRIAVRQEQRLVDAASEQLGYLSDGDYILLSAEHKKLMEDAREKFDKAEAAKKKAEDDVAEYEKLVGSGSTASLSSLRRAIEEAQNRLNAAYSVTNDLEANLEAIAAAETALKFARQEYSEAMSKAAAGTSHERQLESALSRKKTASDNADKATKELAEAEAKVRADLAKSRADANYKLDSAKDALETAEEEEAEAKAKAALTVEEANDNIRELERELEQKKATLDIKQQKDAEDSGIAALDLRATQNEIRKQEELVSRLTDKSIGTAVTAGAGGTISRIDCVAGTTTKPDTPLITIEVTEMGYTLSFSVTNEQAAKVSTGDRAEIQYFWYGNAEARLVTIKPDAADPSKRKTLVFSVTGDVQPGQELQIQMGGKGQEYETVVPNNALREDNNGKFVLKVSSKESPLGIRYIAERVDVTVSATDGTNTAVTGALMQNDFIITTATKPINPGDQVRIAGS